MKFKTDPRHLHRIKLMKSLFSLSFHDSFENIAEEGIQEIATHIPKIDELILKAAPEWPLKQINRVDLAILRISVYELTQTDTPHKVIIDEAVEIAKEYGSENSAKFINGVLGTIHEKLS